MEGGNILKGDLTYIRHCPPPFWVIWHTANNFSERAYVRVSHGGGLLAFLHPFPYNRGSSIHGDRGFVRTANNEILTAFLKPDNHTLDQRTEPLLYVRMPNHNHTVYSGALQYIDGSRPDWL